MPSELNINFPDPQHIVVSLSGGDFENEQTKPLSFTSQISEENRKEILWYLEKYATQYSTEIDDKRANLVVTQLSEFGKSLFKSVFYDETAKELFRDFQNADEKGRLLTITAETPAILSLPWELLHHRHGFLIYDKPRISIRRAPLRRLEGVCQWASGLLV